MSSSRPGVLDVFAIFLHLSSVPSAYASALLLFLSANAEHGIDHIGSSLLAHIASFIDSINDRDLFSPLLETKSILHLQHDATTLLR